MANYRLQTPVEHDTLGRGTTRTYRVQRIERTGGRRVIEHICVDWENGTSTWHEPGTLHFMDPPAVRDFILRLEHMQ